MIRKGVRIRTSGTGRTELWLERKGTVTKKSGNSVFVIWDNCFFEDEMDLSEVVLAGDN